MEISQKFIIGLLAPTLSTSLACSSPKAPASSTPTKEAPQAAAEKPGEHRLPPEAPKPDDSGRTPKPTAKSLVHTQVLQLDRDSKDGDDTLAVEFRIEPGWHIYWINPGDSGLATQFQVKSGGFAKWGPLMYPAPQRWKSAGGIVSYGYDKYVALFRDLPPLAEGTTIQVEAQWLVCKESCLRGKTVQEVTIGEKSHPFSPALKNAWDKIPKAMDPKLSRATWSEENEGTQALSINVGGAPTPNHAEFFPYETAGVDYKGLESTKKGIQLRFDKRGKDPWPAKGPQGVVEIRQGGNRQYYEINEAWPKS